MNKPLPSMVPTWSSRPVRVEVGVDAAVTRDGGNGMHGAGRRRRVSSVAVFAWGAGLVCGVVCAASVAANDATVQWQGGRQQKAELAGIAAERLFLRIDGQESAVAAAEVHAWGRLREPPRGPAFLLRGGSLIVVEDWNVSQDRIRGDAFWATELSLERRLLRAAILSWSTAPMTHDRELRTWLGPATPLSPPSSSAPSSDPSSASASSSAPSSVSSSSAVPSSASSSSSARDQLVLESGDTVSGSVVGWEEAANEDPRRLRVKLARGETRIAADAIRAIIWSSRPSTASEEPAKKPASATGWILGLRDGSLLRCERIEDQETGTAVNGAATAASSLRLKLRDGIDLTCNSAVLRDELVFVQPLAPRVRFLSDMETNGYRHVPLFSLPWGFERDANAAGGALRCGGTRYLKGLGMHATSRLAFSLAEPFRRFQARLGIDDAAGNRAGGELAVGKRGSVIFRVYLDRGAGKWESAFASGVVRGGEAPLPLDLDITGAQGLALIVDAADHGDQGDLANWLDARVE